MERIGTHARMDTENIRDLAGRTDTRPGHVVHHSLIDWNFQPLSGFHINGQRYVSAPGALCRPFDTRPLVFGYFSLKGTIAGDLTDGMISTYHLWEDWNAEEFWIFFRPQTAPYLGLPANTYAIWSHDNRTDLVKRVAGVQTTLAGAAESPAHVKNTWYNHRVTWYTWLDAGLSPILRVIYDSFEGGIWKNYFTFDHQPPLFGTPVPQPIGFAMNGNSLLVQSFIDDTYVYRRT